MVSAGSVFALCSSHLHLLTFRFLLRLPARPGTDSFDKEKVGGKKVKALFFQWNQAAECVACHPVAECCSSASLLRLWEGGKKGVWVTLSTLPLLMIICLPRLRQLLSSWQGGRICFIPFWLSANSVYDAWVSESESPPLLSGSFINNVVHSCCLGFDFILQTWEEIHCQHFFVWHLLLRVYVSVCVRMCEWTHFWLHCAYSSLF